MISTQRLATDIVAITLGNISVIVACRLRILYTPLFISDSSERGVYQFVGIPWSLGGTLNVQSYSRRRLKQLLGRVNFGRRTTVDNLTALGKPRAFVCSCPLLTRFRAKSHTRFTLLLYGVKLGFSWRERVREEQTFERSLLVN